MSILSRLREHHRWFMRKSFHYLGYDEFRRASLYKLPFVRAWTGWPLLRAWCRFMWFSRHDIWGGER